MKKILFLCVLPLTFVWGSEPQTTPAPASEPSFTGEAAKIRDQLVDLFSASKNVNSKVEAERKIARDKIEKAMDWDRVAKDCLGNTDWNKASDSNRQSYRNLLHDVIVKTAYTRLDTFWDGASYRFNRIDVKGSQAQVTAAFKIKNEDFTLDYYLTKKGSGWYIYDVAFEDIRYSENIREQVRAFLKEKGFSSLLAKLKKRRDELDEGSKTKKT